MGALHGQRRRRRRDGGFTLIELLMTLGVTTIGLIGLLSLHLSIVRGNESASRTAEAAQIGHATLESLRAAPQVSDIAALLTGNPADAPPFDVPWCRRAGGVVEATAVGRNGMTYRCRVVVIELPASPDLLRIRVEIGWTDDGATQGTQGGIFDHLIAVELIRTRQEAL